jgi:hypothetical protein
LEDSPIVANGNGAGEEETQVALRSRHHWPDLGWFADLAFLGALAVVALAAAALCSVIPWS